MWDIHANDETHGCANVCLFQHDLNQRECVGRMITCAQVWNKRKQVCRKFKTKQTLCTDEWGTWVGLKATMGLTFPHSPSDRATSTDPHLRALFKLDARCQWTRLCVPWHFCSHTLQKIRSDKNLVWTVWWRANEASKGKWAKRAPLRIQQTHLVTHIQTHLVTHISTHLVCGGGGEGQRSAFGIWHPYKRGPWWISDASIVSNSSRSAINVSPFQIPPAQRAFPRNPSLAELSFQIDGCGAHSKMSGFTPCWILDCFKAHPTSSAVKNTFLAVKKANYLEFSPHPKCWQCLGRPLKNVLEFSKFWAGFVATHNVQGLSNPTTLKENEPHGPFSSKKWLMKVQVLTRYSGV